LDKAIKQKLYEDLKRFEGLKLKPYRCSAGKLTIGYGRNIEDCGITEVEAEVLLYHDCESAYNEAAGLLPNEDQKEVIIVVSEMIFQLGLKTALTFKKFFSAIKAKNYKVAAMEIENSLWHKQTPTRTSYLISILNEL
jgi:lysozyme